MIIRDNERLTYNVSDAAAVLNVSRNTMYAIMRRDDFHAAFRVGDRWLISREGLKDWMTKQIAHCDGNKDNG